MEQDLKKVILPGFVLAGLGLKEKTINRDGRSEIDCKGLWEKFEKEDFAGRIPEKLTNELYAVYYDYEGDHNSPFRYFIGYKINPNSKVPVEMQSLVIPAQTYSKIIARGVMPDCMVNTWKKIWDNKFPVNRKYKFDLELYDERSQDRENAEVDILIS